MKRYSKKKGLSILILFVVILALCIYTVTAGFGDGKKGSARNIKLGLDLEGGVSITYVANEEHPSVEEMNDTIYKLQKRLETYSTEANVYQQGENRITVEIPGVTNANEILNDLGSPGSLYFIAETDSSGNSNWSFNSTTGEYELTKTIEDLEADGSIVCTGSDVANAEGLSYQSSSNVSQEYVVSLEFTEEGTQKFADATEKAYSAGESIGIYYDGRFVSVPKVNAVITDGKAEITGMSTLEEASEIASYIRIGGLKLTLSELRSNVVGAQLGQEALHKAIIGGIIGLSAVILILILVYLLPGVIAAFALVFYTSVMLLLLNLFNMTLTLPGIAGIILSIGMAVDANVIIFTRIQEEVQNGASISTAINAGFNKAMGAIIDSNVTTIIAALVIIILGTGTIKGFAETLITGVVLSMLTACFLTKLLVKSVFSVGLDNRKTWARPKKERHYNFIKAMPRFLIVAILVIAIGAGFMIVNGANGKRALNFSLDFVGGTSTTVEFNEDYSLSELDTLVKPIIIDVTGDASVSMQKVVGSDQVIIKTRTLSQEEREQVSQALINNFGVDGNKITSETISASIGAEMRDRAILSVVIAVCLMLLYIFLRFHDIRYAGSAIIALCHDVLITLMSYAILRISVGSSFIAVMLTILGYSINSTIVIFDRIREERKRRGDGDLISLVNDSINSTLTRSIYTNLTTFISILGMYIIGVASIKEFLLPMMVGIVAGALSSVFLTGPLWCRMKIGKKMKEYPNS